MTPRQQRSLDASFGALADPTRRAILLRLGRSQATITELAQSFDMTLTGLKKHVRILEDAGLVATEKVGRTRHCRLGRPERQLDDIATWMTTYRAMVEDRLDHLDAFLQRGSK